MKLLDYSFSSPFYNLACDEALLLMVDESPDFSILRFWYSPTPFVVLGHANKIVEEVYFDMCQIEEIPILRRSSGGGTVVIGPGSLNYTLILPIPKFGPFHHLNETNRYILKRNLKALSKYQLHHLAYDGITDLTYQGRKFSGNAQRRKKNALMFHGTFLYDFDISLIKKILPLPSRQPHYRKNRSHDQFLTNLPLKSSQIQETIQKEWQANTPQTWIPFERIEELAETKYKNHDWIFKF